MKYRFVPSLNIARIIVLYACALLVTHAQAGTPPINFDSGTLGALSPVSGKWIVDGGKALEMSDTQDAKGRPFFATFPAEAADNTMLVAEFQLFDGVGQVVISPSWHDADNYVAAVWNDLQKISLVEVRDGVETVLAQRHLDEINFRDAASKPLTVGVAVSGGGMRAYVAGKQVIEAAAAFDPSPLRAVGGRWRQVGFISLKTEPVEGWVADRSLLRALVVEKVVGRSAFYRNEPAAVMKLSLRNVTRETLRSVRITASIDGMACPEQTLEIAPRSTASFDCPIPANRLRPDDYHVSVIAQPEGFKASEAKYPFKIVARANPDRFPVMLWGSVPVQGVEKLVELGFTDVFGFNTDYHHLWTNPDANRIVRDDAALKSHLDAIERAMAAGMHCGVSCEPGVYLTERVPELRRIDRAGKQYERHNVCCLLPDAQRFSQHVAATVAKTHGAHPAFRTALINSELRDGAQVCFHKEDIEAYRAATGKDIPEAVKDKGGVSYKSIADFPASRVVPDDHPLLEYYRWYWKEGDGWVRVNKLIHEELKKGGRGDLVTWFDPAVRTPPIYGSGAGMDMLGQWTYTNPSPIRVGMTADELLNMARGRQKTFQMIQAIWYRSETAPLKQPATHPAGTDPWYDNDPDAMFITPAPAHMTAAFWSAISRPIDMIGYFGIEALLPGNAGVYEYTNSDTADAMARMHREVLQPLGPMLRKIGDRPADVAFLESFASQIFAGQGTNGWAGGNIGAYWMACQYAGLQSSIVFEETIIEAGLDGFKVLVLPGCEVLPQLVFDQIVAFQKRGGIVLADERLVPGIKPDWVLPTSPAINTRTLANAPEVGLQLREFLKGKYASFATSTDPQVVLRTRQRDNVQYLFALNDRREAGEYVGHYGLVKELGLPASTSITVQRAGVKVWDLIEGCEVLAQSDAQSTRFDATLAPGQGKIFVISERVPATLLVHAPTSLKRGETASIEVSVLDAAGDPVAMTVPLDIQIIDSNQRPAEPSGAYAGVAGNAKVAFDSAENDLVGTWQITVLEQMTGLKETHYFQMR